MCRFRHTWTVSPIQESAIERKSGNILVFMLRFTHRPGFSNVRLGIDQWHTHDLSQETHIGDDWLVCRKVDETEWNSRVPLKAQA